GAAAVPAGLEPAGALEREAVIGHPGEKYRKAADGEGFRGEAGKIHHLALGGLDGEHEVGQHVMDPRTTGDDDAVGLEARAILEEHPSTLSGRLDALDAHTFAQCASTRLETVGQGADALAGGEHPTGGVVGDGSELGG